jgi:hypothetical protein
MGAPVAAVVVAARVALVLVVLVVLVMLAAGYVNKTKHGWGYYQANGKIGHAGPANVRFGEDFRNNGDVVEVRGRVLIGS